MRALLAIAAAAAGGFLLGRAGAVVEWSRDLDPATSPASNPVRHEPRPIAAPRAHPFGALAAELAALPLPRLESNGLLEWRGLAAAIDAAFAEQGLPLEQIERAAAAATLAEAADLAGMLDARAFVATAADQSESRAALLALARRIDLDATRDAIRAPLLAHDADAVRILAAELRVEMLPPRTAALLGTALLFSGDLEEALERWRGCATEHPEDAVVHLLLGWRLLALAPPEIDEARRHLEAARALLPRSDAVKRRLEALR